MSPNESFESERRRPEGDKRGDIGAREVRLEPERRKPER
jgi:hypothetical protein